MNTKKNDWQKKNILIVEDDETNFIFLEECLSSTNAKLTRAQSGEEAMNYHESGKPVNLILMDIKLPGINGLEVTRRIHAVNPELPIIAQTAYAMEEEREKALQSGCNEVITKPIDIDRLFELLGKYLNQ